MLGEKKLEINTPFLLASRSLLESSRVELSSKARELEWDKCWFYHVLKMSPQGWSLFSKVETRSGGGSWAKIGIKSCGGILALGNIAQCWFWADERWRETSLDDLWLPPQPFDNFWPLLHAVRTSPVRLEGGEIKAFETKSHRGIWHTCLMRSCSPTTPPSVQTPSTVSACILVTTNYFPVFAYFCLPVLFCSLQVQERMQ